MPTKHKPPEQKNNFVLVMDREELKRKWDIVLMNFLSTGFFHSKNIEHWVLGTCDLWQLCLQGAQMTRKGLKVNMPSYQYHIITIPKVFKDAA